ncbi:MAG TPA: hypothetical protein VE963_05455 [Reyranella sp.]|nr:hypothetical protein [Reyranella sp.]
MHTTTTRGTIALVLAAGLAGGCNPIPVANTAGPKDPDSVTVFTLALQPGSVTGCILADPSMTRPVTLTVKNDAATLLTSGGIHYDLTRTAPNVYEGGYWIKMRADLASRPKTLTLRNDDGSCQWAASAA